MRINAGCFVFETSGCDGMALARIAITTGMHHSTSLAT